jgi:phytoene dehydrogenase-like protein
VIDAAIVGGGLAGLACAGALHRAGLSVRVLERSDDVGGRVRTDVVDGFRLDRGFQVLLTAYPEAERTLDYAGLDLRPFFSGALVRWHGRFATLADPFRHPVEAASSFQDSPGTMLDKWRVMRLRARCSTGSLASLYERPELTSLEYLRRAGFSTEMIDGFFRPFLGGVFLERDLATSSRMLEFVIRMFAEGQAAVPAAGMGAIPRQLASRLPPGAIQLGAQVTSIAAGGVTLADGEVVPARAVVLAVDQPAAGVLTGQAPPASRSVACVYYAAPEPPVRDPVLLLSGMERGPINNCAVMSNVNPACAPAGRALVSVSIVGAADPDDEALEAGVRRQLRTWWGRQVDEWQALRTYRILHALPVRGGGALEPVELPARDGAVFTCGDHRDTPSIQGALASGRRAADAVVAALGR